MKALEHRTASASSRSRRAAGGPWGHNGAVPGYFTNAFTRGDAAPAVVLVNRDPRRRDSAVIRALDAALCS